MHYITVSCITTNSGRYQWFIALPWPWGVYIGFSDPTKPCSDDDDYNCKDGMKWMLMMTITPLNIVHLWSILTLSLPPLSILPCGRSLMCVWLLVDALLRGGRVAGQHLHLSPFLWIKLLIVRSYRRQPSTIPLLKRLFSLRSLLWWWLNPCTPPW